MLSTVGAGAPADRTRTSNPGIAGATTDTPAAGAAAAGAEDRTAIRPRSHAASKPRTWIDPPCEEPGAAHDVALHRAAVELAPLQDVVAALVHAPAPVAQQINARLLVERGPGCVVPHLDVVRVHGGDRVELSSLDQFLSKLKTNDIRADKVASVKAAINDGSYDDDHKLNVAIDKLLDDINR